MKYLSTAAQGLLLLVLILFTIIFGDGNDPTYAPDRD